MFYLDFHPQLLTFSPRTSSKYKLILRYKILNVSEETCKIMEKVTSSWGGSCYTPMAFTEQAVAMLSSVLNSSIAI